MLECPALLLSPWRRQTIAGGEQAVATRQVLDLRTQQCLGLVRELALPAWPIVRWLARRSWQVLETEDESLLLTLLGPWGLIRPWEVYDAEDRLVCSIHANAVYDAAGFRCARAEGGPGPVRLLGGDDLELAAFAWTARGLEIHFAPRIDDDPYAKMAVLGAALALRRS